MCKRARAYVNFRDLGIAKKILAVFYFLFNLKLKFVLNLCSKWNFVQPPVGGGNRRFDQNQPINQLPQQQQAMLAAQLSAFAMAAAGNLNLPLFDQQGGPNMPNNGNNNNRQGGDNRRNFNRRNGGQGRGPNNNREDQSPFPGYDNKRARY